MFLVDTLIVNPLGYIMWLCFNVVKDYGWSIVIFTLITKIVLMPISIWVQKNSIKMVKLQPKVNEIIAVNVGNKDKAAKEQMELYKNEKYKPLAGLIPLLIQIVIVIAFISIMYNPLFHILHIDKGTVNTLSSRAEALSGNELGSAGPLMVIEYINNPDTFVYFSELITQSPAIAQAIQSIQGMNIEFLGLNVVNKPSLSSQDIYWIIPVLSGLSSFLLSFFQNRINVLQKEQGFWSKWLTAALLVVFSIYFAFVVPFGVGIYWILGNIFSIIILYIVNYIYNPEKYIDYEKLEESKKMLQKSKEMEKELKQTPEQKSRSKQDYLKFFKEDNKKELVYYSEKSGFYKYFEDQISYITSHSDIIVHYITSDPNDAIFKKDLPQLIPYYIDDNKLISLFMKLDSSVMVSTTPNLQTYHLKRSLVKKDVEYIYEHHAPASINMCIPKEALDHFDTILCVGQHQIDEIREIEKLMNLKEKKLCKIGYPLIDNLIKSYESMVHSKDNIKRILIAPSWQADNILDTCLDKIIENLLYQDYQIVIRPHPEYIKRYFFRWDTLIQKYNGLSDNRIILESDFTSNTTIFTADLVITDWSGIGVEFSYSTKKPTLFINTPMKVMNEDFEKFKCVPLEISLREVIGTSLNLDELSKISDTVEYLFDNQEKFKLRIQDTMDKNLFNHRRSVEVGGQYIIDAVLSKRDL